MMYVSCAMVSKEIVKLCDGLWNVLVAAKIHDVEQFAYVCGIYVCGKQMEAIFLRQYSRGRRDWLG
jgi:hypothetical protein